MEPKQKSKKNKEDIQNPLLELTPNSRYVELLSNLIKL